RGGQGTSCLDRDGGQVPGDGVVQFATDLQSLGDQRLSLFGRGGLGDESGAFTFLLGPGHRRPYRDAPPQSDPDRQQQDGGLQQRSCEDVSQQQPCDGNGQEGCCDHRE